MSTSAHRHQDVCGLRRATRGLSRRDLIAGALALVNLALLDASSPPAPSAPRPTAAPGLTIPEPSRQQAPPAIPAPRQSAANVVMAGVVADPINLDPAQTLTLSDLKIANNLFDGLVNQERGSYRIVPGLAERWDVSTDGLTYTFSLRNRVTFHDGTLFNSEAARFSFERQLDETSPYFKMGNFPYRTSRLGTIRDVVAVDNFTLQITLTQPFAPLLDYLASNVGMIVSPRAVMQLGTGFADRPVGTGPFRFVSWDKGQQLVLDRNPNYWGGAPKLQSIGALTLPDPRTRVDALRTGEVQLIESISPADVQALQADQVFQIIRAPSPHVWYVTLNTRAKPLDDLRVRQALNHAVNKDAIVRDILGGLAIVADEPLSPVFSAYQADGITRYPYDPPKAKQLLDAAGQSAGFDIELAVPESGNGMQQPVAMAQAIQANFAQVGVNARLKTYEWSAYQSIRVAGDFQMAAFSWTPSVGNPDVILYQKFHSSQISPNGYNNTFYADPELDELLDDARVTTDERKRQEDYKEAQRRITAAATHIFVDHDANLVAATSRLQGFKVHPSSAFVFAPEVALQ